MKIETPSDRKAAFSRARVLGATKVGAAQERFVAQVETALGVEDGCSLA